MTHSPKAHVLLALAATLLLAGCATSAATPASDAPASDAPAATASPAPADAGAGGSLHTIPLTTNRPSDPPLPDDYDQDSNSRLTPEEASLDQLWGLANSEVGDGASSSVIGPTAGIADFAAAITARCYPIRTADEVAELERLKAAYESVIGEQAAFEPARAYFLRATALCM